jgi:hypothetical protein
MIKIKKILLSLIILVTGWLALGFAFTTKLGPLISTSALFLGIGLFIGGVIYFVRAFRY